MKLSIVIAALRQRCPSFAGRVAGAAELKALPETGKMLLPAVYVVPSSDDADEQRSITDYLQNVTEGFAVVCVMNNTPDNRGQAASFDVVDTVRSELWRALLGWQPDDNAHPISYAGGQLIQMDRGRLYYQFDFIRTLEVSENDTRQQQDLNALDVLQEIGVDVDYIDPGNGPDGNIEHHTEITFKNE
ncbi:hypothetical protein ACLEDV_08090 [Lonsdalea quercina]|uniref:phage tail terminator protein n=1 Tax=Lonsdalea quercina TaxID=71657 RepID=UPI0039771EC0